MRHAQLRRAGRPLAFGVIFGFVLLGTLLGGFRGFAPAAVKRAFELRKLALAAYALCGPLILAHLHSREATSTVEAVVFPAALVLALAALFGAGLDRVEAPLRTRRALATLGVLAQLGVAFLGLDRSGMLLALLTA